MPKTSQLNELLSTLLDRRPFHGWGEREGTIRDLCLSLLDAETEVSGLQTAAAVLDRYGALGDEERRQFFDFLGEDLDIDPDAIARVAARYKSDPSAETYGELAAVNEPRRQELFRRLNEAPGATAELVRMRSDLLEILGDNPSWGRTDLDLVHLLRSWFNRGFLVLRQITWDSPASVLEKIIAYEAVHEIHNWDDLRRRLHPGDRRCFAFFHPSMPDDPLIFVEVALTQGIPNSIQDVLSEERHVLDASEADTAVFYSISNCQSGLAGISFGNSLIKQVARDLSAELPGLKKFSTLSPIPGLRRWAEQGGHPEDLENPAALKRLTAHYLLDARTPDGKPVDPVARFHLGNGAMVHMVHANADTSEKGMSQSGGAMVSYLYDLGKIYQHMENFGKTGAVAASSSVKSLARQAARKSSSG